MASPLVSDAVKVRLKEEFARLDPVALLCDIRLAQQMLSDATTRYSHRTCGLAKAWKTAKRA
ncbi:MAG: hypothetical protein GIX02_13715 [Candidatus Eremiobacteraeota bacterium]|nr:hypothetical protein [Candidatus Eremiobacteraeota bacterium]